MNVSPSRVGTITFLESKGRKARDSNEPLTMKEINDFKKEAGENATQYAYKVRGCTCPSCDGGMPVCT